jgi:hypothetical protein
VKPVKVVAHLVSPLAGDAPMLESLLADAMCGRYPTVPHERHDPAPPWDSMPPIPILKGKFGDFPVYRASSPIPSDTLTDDHKHIHSRFPTDYASVVSENSRIVIATGNGKLKSTRLPIRTRLVQSVTWFAVIQDKHSPSVLRKELQGVKSIGMDRSRLCGRVLAWEVEKIDEDLSWFAPHPDGQVLMRPLPICDAIPDDMIGGMEYFGAFHPPMWHPGRMTEIYAPC